MTDMIEVRRTNYPGRLYHSGHYTVDYFHDRKKIAFYDSRSDTLYLRTELIGSDFKRSAYERAKTCESKDVYEYLFAMLNVDETTKISEFC